MRYIKYAIVGLTALSCCAEATAEAVELSSAGDSCIFENKRCSEVDTREITVGGLSPGIYFVCGKKISVGAKL